MTPLPPTLCTVLEEQAARFLVTPEEVLDRSVRHRPANAARRAIVHALDERDAMTPEAAAALGIDRHGVRYYRRARCVLTADLAQARRYVAVVRDHGGLEEGADALGLDESNIRTVLRRMGPYLAQPFDGGEPVEVPVMPKVKWTAEQDAELRKVADRGLTAKQARDVLAERGNDRTVSAVKARAQRIGVRFVPEVDIPAAQARQDAALAAAEAGKRQREAAAALAASEGRPVTNSAVSGLVHRARKRRQREAERRAA